MDLNITPEQIEAWKSGILIQDAMPQLTASEREFLITGVIEKEFDELFNE